MKHFVLSLDFEFRWGVQDRLGPDGGAYRSNLEAVESNVKWLLHCFAERNIACTWATVGAIACQDWQDFHSSLPYVRPNYANNQLDYLKEYLEEIDRNGSLHFSPDSIDQILKTPYQELGLHSFGHIYAREQGMSYEAFESDLMANKKIFEERYGVKTRALVYPRNQVNFQSELLESGIIECFRGNESCVWDDPENLKRRTVNNRVLALVHALAPLQPRWHHIGGVQASNIASSGMLKVNWPSIIRERNFAVVSREIRKMPDDCFLHTWFHPHNIGKDASRKTELLKFFDSIGTQVAQGKLASQNMSSMSEVIESFNG